MRMRMHLVCWFVGLFLESKAPYVAQANLELKIILVQLSECHEYKWVLLLGSGCARL